MKKFIFLVIFCISFLQINVVKSNDNIAFIDLDFVIKNSILGKQVLNTINNLDKKNVESLKKKNKELKEKETELKNKKNINPNFVIFI